MTAWKPGIAALLLVVGLTSSARAQAVIRGGKLVGYVNTPPNESSLDVYSVYGGYGHYDQPVPYVSLGGAVPVGRAKTQAGSAGGLLPAPSGPKAAPKLSNNLGGVSNLIKAQTAGKPGIGKNGVSTARGAPRGGRGL